MYQNVIFDLDGTLLNTLEDLKDSTNYALAQHGYPTRTLEEVRCFVGNGIRKLIDRAVPEGTSVEKTDKVFATFREYYATHSRVKTSMYEGTEQVMDALKEQNISMAIVSNKADDAVKDLAKYYFAKYIDVAIGEREGISRKPAPDSVYEAMRLLGATKENTVYVGDSDVDRATAKNAGIPCISVTWGFRSEELLVSLEPEYLIHKPEEILSVVTGK